MKHKDNLRNSVWKSFRKGGTHKLVMLFLADKEYGGQSVATISDIALACGVSERQAQYVMKDLVNSGHLVIVGNQNGGFSLPRIYKVCPSPKRVQKSAPKKGAEFSTLEGCSGVHPHIYMFTKGERTPEKNHPSQGRNVCGDDGVKNSSSLAGDGRVAA